MPGSSKSVLRRSALAAAVCCALGAGPACGQTAFGSSTTIVFPLMANTNTFTSVVTLYNPNPADVTVSLDYFDSVSVLPPAVPGAKPCSDVVIPANGSVEFGVPAQCTLEPGANHFGQMIVSDVAGTNQIFGYQRTSNNANAGFSVEGFPTANFATDTTNATGLRGTLPKLPPAPTPLYQTNCFVAAQADSITYELKLLDGTTGAQIGNTLSGALNAFEHVRYLDVFEWASAPDGDYANVRAEFTRTSGGVAQMIGFCTVQDNATFGADFRIAKTTTPPPVAITTVPWQGPMVTLFSNTLAYIFMGPTASVTLPATGNISAYGSGSFARQTGSQEITVGVCYQNQSGPGPILAMGSPTTVTVTTTETSQFGAGSATVAAGSYNVGLCATNNGAGSVNKNGNTSGFAFVTP
jgi:hypothetical protein